MSNVWVVASLYLPSKRHVDMVLISASFSSINFLTVRFSFYNSWNPSVCCQTSSRSWPKKQNENFSEPLWLKKVHNSSNPRHHDKGGNTSSKFNISRRSVYAHILSPKKNRTSRLRALTRLRSPRKPQLQPIKLFWSRWSRNGWSGDAIFAPPKSRFYTARCANINFNANDWKIQSELVFSQYGKCMRPVRMDQPCSRENTLHSRTAKNIHNLNCLLQFPQEFIIHMENETIAKVRLHLSEFKFIYHFCLAARIYMH